MGALRKPEPLEVAPIDDAKPVWPNAPPYPRPVLLTRVEKADPGAGPGEASRSATSARNSVLRPYPIDREPTPPFVPAVAPSFRKLLLAGAGAILLAICLGLVLGFSRPQPAVAPRPAAARAQTTLQTMHSAKPSAYGEAFMPPRAASRSHRPASPSPTADDPAKPRN